MSQTAEENVKIRAPTLRSREKYVAMNRSDIGTLLVADEFCLVERFQTYGVVQSLPD
jgi:hypothetical protein